LIFSQSHALDRHLARLPEQHCYCAFFPCINKSSSQNSALLRPVEKFDHRADMALNLAIFIMTARHQ
jgi:hypothetical protein